MGETITVIKLDHSGKEVFRYVGQVLARGATWVQLEARFNRDAVPVGAGVVFLRGDRFVEWFYSDRWYNIFEVHGADDDRIKAWYCNVTRPAVLTADSVMAEDLALDLLVLPDGEMVVLDEDEFAALALSEQERTAALAALESLRRAVRNHTPPFDTPVIR